MPLSVAKINRMIAALPGLFALRRPKINKVVTVLGRDALDELIQILRLPPYRLDHDAAALLAYANPQPVTTS